LDAFRFFDIKGKGYVNKYEFEDGLKNYGVFSTQNELYLIFRKLDADNDGLLKYTEFADAITPKAAEYASLLSKRVPTFADDALLDIVFSYDTKK
jgi:Ca2+-binding EF-hand superfamily protein